jgi:exodeoxyribonuclease VII large subunit
MAFFKLNVPFKDKDEAKKFGAKWYSEDKYWYYSGDELPEGLRRWYPLYKPVDGKEGVYLDTETGEIIGDSTEITPVNNETVNDPYAKYRTVSEINRMISDIVNATNEFRAILVKGEVTNFDGKKGRHYYFAIKDDSALLPCVMWDSTAAYALKFKLEKGQQVAIAGSLEYYDAQGKAQLIVSTIENIGDGEANLAFIKLKAKLEAEGLFAPERKKSIPKHPEQVGIITSKNGQAIKDICKIAEKRNPYVQLILYHVNVQGVNAVSTIVNGIKTLDGMGLDTIIVGRGGGSDEELNSYNHERIARAVAEAKTPIVSAVGHQGHWTLIDFVADKRVATPSEAAEETIPDVMTDISRIELLKNTIRDRMKAIIENRRLLIKSTLSDIEKNSPQNRLNENKDRLKHLSELMDMNIRSAFQKYNNRFEVLLAELNGLSPTAKLVGGFGYVTKENKPVKNVADVKPGDDINIRMHDGDITSTVK